MLSSIPLRSLRYRLCRLWWRARGVTIADGVRLEPGVHLWRGVARGAPGRIHLGQRTELCRGALLHAYGGSIVLGSDVFVGPYAVIYGHGGVEIGDHTLVSMHCRILSSEHTLSPMGVPIRSQPDILHPTRIGRDVWLGAGVTVLGGVTLGDGCVVGAGAVVTRDLPPGTVARGVPARACGSRPDTAPSSP